MVCARMGAAVVCTDQHADDVLSATLRNIQLNGSAEGAAALGEIEVVGLDWSRCARQQRVERVTEPHSFDIAVASDTVLDKWMGQRIPHVLRYFLRGERARTPHPA